MRLYLPAPLRDHLLGAVSRLEISFDVKLSIRRLKRYGWQWGRDWEYLVVGSAFLNVRASCIGHLDASSTSQLETMLAVLSHHCAQLSPHVILTSFAERKQLAAFSLMVMAQPLLFKLFLIAAYTTALLVPFTSQFFLPATPVFSWLLFFYSSQFIPKSYRPHIWVSVLPTLESILYGANISDLLTRWTNPVLDVMAWVPYGVVHFVAPFVVAAVLFVFSPPGAVKFWAAAFGYMNLVGVMIQIAFPCAPPWYELREGLVPANYNMRGSAGGLARIDSIFGGHGYENTFSGAPVPFGAFPSLHAGCSTMEALFLSHFFPKGRVFYWIYVFWLYWSTMYLTHHYLIDLVAGGSLTCAFFYYYLSKMPDELRHPTTHGASSTPYRSGLATAIPLDEESGLPKTFAHYANGSGNGHANGYGGWEDDDEDGFDGASEAGEEAMLMNGGPGAADRGRDSMDVPAQGDLGSNPKSSSPGRYLRN
ncbi:SPOSA6832_03379, partial [Sporobolomyces salmonicolor]